MTSPPPSNSLPRRRKDLVMVLLSHIAFDLNQRAHSPLMGEGWVEGDVSPSLLLPPARREDLVMVLLSHIAFDLNQRVPSPVNGGRLGWGMTSPPPSNSLPRGEGGFL